MTHLIGTGATAIGEFSRQLMLVECECIVASHDERQERQRKQDGLHCDRCRGVNRCEFGKEGESKKSGSEGRIAVLKGSLYGHINFRGHS